MTEGSYSLPPGWRWVRLGEVCDQPQYGYTQSATNQPVGPKFVRISDISEGNIRWQNVPYCRCDTKSFEKYKLFPHDILFASSGSAGLTLLLTEVPYNAIFASYLIRIRLKPEVLPSFAAYFFQSPFYRDQIRPRGAAQININASMIKELLLPLPPL